MKLTSFDKLIERTCSSIRNVRLHCDADLKQSGTVGTSGMAPDAVYVFFSFMRSYVELSYQCCPYSLPIIQGDTA